MSINNVSRNAACPCGSGKKFKRCHGAVEKPESSENSNVGAELRADGFYQNNLMTELNKGVCADVPKGCVVAKGNVPPGFLIIQEYFPIGLCNEIVEFVEQSVAFKATVQSADDAHKSELSEIRQTDIISLKAIENMHLPLIKKLFSSQISEFYSKPIDYFEYPEVLRYEKGGYYTYHADSENWYAESKAWKKKINRDVSVLIYLNEEFSGGELVFPNFNFRLKPKRGMVVVFPSDHRYIHKAEPTTQGKRYAIVSWATFKGSERMDGPKRTDLVHL